MVHFSRKHIVFILVILIGILSSGINNIYAKNGLNKGNINLSQKYNGKKLDRIKGSIKGKKDYRFLISSNETLDSIKAFFVAGDKKAKVKQYGENTFMVRLPLKSKFLSDDLSLIKDGILPGKLGNYDVIAPEIVEGFFSNYVSGEQSDKLRGNNKIGADTFQEELQTKGKIKVGILDTGIDYNHSDLDANYDSVISYDFVNEDNDAMDDNGHGTQVAGIIGAEVNGEGIYGINSNTDLISLKVLDASGLGTTYDILEAIEYAKLNNVKVINMSFGGVGTTQNNAVCEAITDAKASGIITVVSAGNNNSNISNTIPAGCSDSIVVGAIDSQNNKASFSNYGTGVIYAPGVDIYSTSLNNSYISKSGTSFSAPFVAGIVSKELAFNNTISYSDLINNIKNNYNLVNIENSGTQIVNTVNQIVTGTGWINTENLFERFSDFTYLFHTDDYIYYKDKLNSGFVYKIINDKKIFGYGNFYVINNANSVYLNNKLYTAEYFNSGEYINYNEFINERNEFYESIGYENNNLDNTKFSTQSIGLGSYDLNHKFSNIYGIKLIDYNPGYFAIDDNYIYYTSGSDGAKLYRKSKDGSGETKLSDNISGYFAIDDNYIYYTNLSDGGNLYRISKDGSGEIKLIDSQIYDFVMDNNYIYYKNSLYGIGLYKISKNGNGEIKLSDNQLSGNFVIDNNYIYYTNLSDGEKLYKISKDGSGEIKLNDNRSYYLAIDDNYIYYPNLSDGSILYRISKDGSGETKLSDNRLSYLGIDNNYIYYANWSDKGIVYRISKDWNGKIKLNDSFSWQFVVDNSYIYYINGSDEYNFYKIKNDGTENHYALNDGQYKSPEILPGKNLSNLKIDIDSIVPSLTNYNFYLANQKTEETLFEANESGVDMMGSDIYLFGDNYINGTRQQILSKVNVGDTIYFDKNGNIGEFTVEYKDDWSIRLEFNGQDLWEYQGARVYIGGSNFTKIDNSKLDGNTNLNLNSIFGLTTDKLYYKIELIGDQSDTTKTPIINSVEFKDGSILSVPTNTTQDPTSEVLNNPTKTYDYIDFSSNVSLVNQNFIKSTDLIGSKNNDNAGDPVTLSKGEFTYDNSLMSIPGVKIPYEFGISYKNQTYYNGPVGVNWDHNYNKYLVEEDNGNVVYYNGKLGIFRFINNGTTFDYNAGIKATLVNTLGVYSINYDDGNIDIFDNTVKKISKQEDRYGNNLTFTYSGGLLDKVTDTLGRDIIYTYNTDDRLQEVVDFNGRKVELSYYDGTTASGSIYDLKTIKINNSVDAVKTINFEYTTGGDDYSNHNITKLIDSKGQTYVENTYNAGDRVATQKFGNGTIIYDYTLDANNSITKNTVTDKLGNLTEYYYDSNHNNTSTVFYNEEQTSSATYNYEYNNEGYIIKETKPRGNGYTYSYDTKGNVLEKRFKADVSLADSSSDLVTTYTYNSLNQVLTTTNPNGVIETNIIDTNGNITSKTISGVKTHSGTTYDIVNNYTYLNDGLVDTTLDGEGNTINFNYNSLGQVKEIVKGTGANSYTGSFTYNDYGNIQSSTDGEGNNKTFTYNAFNGVSSGITAEGITTSYQYDLNNNKTKQTVYLTGGIEVNTYFYYDLLDNLTSSLTDTGNGTTLLTTYKYDDNNNLIEKQEGNGAPTKYNYNAFGKIKEERIVMLDTDNSKDIVTTYTYDSNGNLVSKTDALGKITIYVYDLYDRLTREIKPNGTYSEFSYNKDGTISSKSIFNSSATILSKTNYFYDGLGKIVNEIKYLDPENNLGAVSTKKVYDKNGKEINIIDSKGNTTTNNYDNLGRIDYSLDALGNKVQYSYDNRDLVISKSVIPNTGTGIITIASLYDNDGRLISETNNLNKTKSLTYNNLNQIISKTDEENNRTDYTLNYLGKILTQTQYVGGNPITTNYGYDERGNLISVTDPESNETRYEFDIINRNTKVIYADNNELLYNYDKNSNLISQSDPNGTTVNNTYDNINLLTNINITTGSGVIGTTSESYIYDDLGRLITTSSGEEGVATDFSYDNLSRLSSETSSGGIVGYEYDSNNNLSKIIHPDLKETTYSYDELNRNTSVSFSGETIATYNFTGIVNDSIAYGNGKQITYDYDELLRLTSLNNGVKTYNYTYDDASNITSDSFKNYNYDNIYRVTGVNDTASGTTLEAFNYDKAGNRITDLNTEYTINDLNQYTTLSGTTLSGSLVYDNNGNITNNGKYNFEYDYKNRLIKVNSGITLITEFTYDTLGRRIQKKTENETINYLYADKNILEEIRNNGIRDYKKVYINGLGTDNLIAYDNEEISLTHAEKQELLFCENRVLPFISDFTKYSWDTLVNRCNELNSGGTAIVTNRYYFHKNHLGSIVGLTNSTGNIVLEYDYDVFGNTYVSDGSGSLVNIDTYEGELYDNNRLYTGREYDKEIELYYLRARYYDSKIGRFISRDPIGQVDDVNLYAYVGNNVVMFVDLFGKEKQLLKDIENGNSFLIELVDRELNIPGGLIVNHTFIVIYSMDRNFNLRKYSIGGHDVDGYLIGNFNDESDIGRKKSTKASILISEPEGMTDTKFVQNIYNEYIDYNKNPKKYTGLGADNPSQFMGNCNNFSSTILKNASNNSEEVQKKIADFNPLGFNLGIGNSFSDNDYSFYGTNY